MRFDLEYLLKAGISARLRRFKERLGPRRAWYELGFRDGWRAAHTGEIATKENAGRLKGKRELPEQTAG